MFLHEVLQDATICCYRAADACVAPAAWKKWLLLGNVMSHESALALRSWADQYKWPLYLEVSVEYILQA